MPFQTVSSDQSEVVLMKPREEKRQTRNNLLFALAPRNAYDRHGECGEVINECR